jgi:hypothetical protein
MCRSGSDWRGSMMANSSRDPYWLAAVRREAIDHPAQAVAIEDTCATCHMRWRVRTPSRPPRKAGACSGTSG